MKNLLAILSVLIFAATQSVYAGWSVSSSVSVNETEMKEEKNCYVISDFVSPVEPLNSPYGHLKQAIGVGIDDNRHTWAYLVFNDSPDLTGYRDRGGNRVITNRAKFDEEILSITYREGSSDRFMFINKVDSSYLSAVKLFIEYLLRSKTLLTEQEQAKGKFYYKHDLSGFKEKYNEARQSCGLERIETILSADKQTEKTTIRDRKHLDEVITILTTFYGNEVNLNHLDVSGITDFSDLFAGQGRFNGDLSEWDVSAGTNFSYMFWDATAFNQDIGEWDVSAGTDFSYMFWSATAFNQDIGEWDVSSGIDFEKMFFEAKSFNQDLSRWQVNPEADTGWMFKDSGVTDFTSYPWYTP